MSWYGWLALTIGLTGWLLTLRRVAWIIATDCSYDYDQTGQFDGETICFSLFFGAVVALAWPVITPIYFLWRHGQLTKASDSIGHAFLKPPKHAREQALQQRIDELERQVGIR